MLRQVAEGVLVHESEIIQSNAVVVQGPSGVLVVDPGITGEEIRDLASELREQGMPVVAGFSTHPDWDHVLWHPDLGDAPRYGTAGNAAEMRELLAHEDWKDRIADALPPEAADDLPLEGFGLITGLPEGSTRVPWDGPGIRVIEHNGHARGHAALLVEDRGVLVAGDMLSDVLVPLLDVARADPIGDYLAGLDLLEEAARDVEVVIPGHGSVGGADEVLVRIAQDRAYVMALRAGDEPDDPRIGSSAKPGWEWVSDVHAYQVQSLRG